MYLFLSPLRDPLQAILVLGQHAHQSAVASRPIPVASVQAENVVGAAEVVDADVAVVSGFEVLLRLFADHGVCPPVVSFAFCWAHISSAKGMSGTSKCTEETRRELVGMDKCRTTLQHPWHWARFRLTKLDLLESLIF